MTAPTLPVDEILTELLAVLSSTGAAVVAAPPGSGKTTRVPAAMVDAGLAREGAVLVVQPRRLAARAMARLVARQRGGDVGGEVGHQVRFDRKAGGGTKLLFVTPGIMKRRLQADPFLDGVAAVVLDEFHERTLEYDLLLALLRELRGDARPDLALVVMSATMDAERVAGFVDGPVIEAPGRAHPLDIRWAPHEDDLRLVDRCVAGVRRALDETEGDVLVFLPGVGEIERCARALGSAAALVTPLHGRLGAAEQDRAITPDPRRRKVILSTNIAETSLTVEGVRVVVDAGWVRRIESDERRGLDQLVLRRVDRAAADQRAGRAGRLGPGVAYRLWTRSTHRSLDDAAPPEVRRLDLGGCVLDLLAWGVDDPRRFDWFEPPTSDALDRAFRHLAALGAVDGSDRLTAIGRAMAALPAEPRLSRMLVEGVERGCAAEAATLAALCGEPEVMTRETLESGAPTAPSDLLLRLDRVLEAEAAGGGAAACRRAGLAPRPTREVIAASRQLRRLVRADRRGAGADEEALLKTVLTGFPDRVARRREAGSDRALMATGSGVALDPTSVVREEDLFTCIRTTGTSPAGGPETRVLWASRVDETWLHELFPWRIEAADAATFDDTREKVVGERTVRYGAITLSSVTCPVPPAVAAQCLAEAVRRDPGRVVAEDEALASFLLRADLLAEWNEEFSLEDDTASLLLDVLVGLCAGRTSFAELRAADVLATVRGTLGYRTARTVDDQMPERLALPSGRTARLRYERGRPPVLSARVQDLFGLMESPRVAGGRKRCLVELLAPNRRPVQLTEDLGSFWRETYARVRKDLRGRYPKHDWPETPPGFTGG